MGTDIIAITGHTLTIREIIDLPKEIDNWTELRTLFLDDYKNKLDHHYTKENLLEKIKEQSYWDREMNEKVIFDLWKNNKELP